MFGGQAISYFSVAGPRAYHRRRKGSVVGGTMASAEHEPITGVWGQSPQRGPGTEPLVRAGVRGRSPPEAESILVIGCPTEPANLASFQKCHFEQYALLLSTGVRVGGGQSAWCPQSRHWGEVCAPGPPRLRRLWGLWNSFSDYLVPIRDPSHSLTL